MGFLPPAASVLGECCTHRQSPRNPTNSLHVVLGESLAHLPAAIVLGDTNIFLIFNIIDGNDPFLSKETGASIDKLRDSSLSG